LNGLQISYGSTTTNRAAILNYIIKQRAVDPGYRVIDIGGAADSWSSPVTNTTVDINVADTEKTVSIDICVDEQWGKLFNKITEQGLYDFAICTHTLEDIYNPITVLKNLPRIARAGVITTPSIYAEIGTPENTNWIGYIHHRWIFDHLDGAMYIIPKLPVLQWMCKGRKFDTAGREEIMYVWGESIPYKMFMNNYLGPNGPTVLHAYNQLINGATADV